VNFFLIIDIEPDFSNELKKICSCKRKSLERSIRKAKLSLIKKELSSKSIRYEDIDLTRIKVLDIENVSLLQDIQHVKEIVVEN